MLFRYFWAVKVIILGPAHPLRGGIADTNESLCRALLKAGHKCEIVSFKLQYPSMLFPGKTQFSNAPAPADLTIRSWVNSINPLNWYRTAKKIRALGPDLVVVRYWIPFLSPALGTIAKALKKHTTVVGLIDNLIPHERRIGDGVFTRYFVKQCHAFVAMSSTVASDIALFSTKPAIVQHHPINENLGELISQDAAREHLKLKPNGKYLLFFGLVRRYKGLDLLLEAMGQEEIKHSDIELLIAGEFYDKQEEYEKLIERNGLTGRVHIRNEFIPATETPAYFCAADLVTQTYHTATQSGITQMAYHFNCPMLVTNVGGLPEIVAHGKVGYVVEKQPKAIAAAIAAFFTEGKAAGFRQNIETEKLRFSWKAFASGLLDFSKDLGKK